MLRIKSRVVCKKILAVTEDSSDLNDLEGKPSEGFSMSILGDATRTWVMIGVLASLLALALLQASCTIYKASKKRTTKVLAKFNSTKLPF